MNNIRSNHNLENVPTATRVDMFLEECKENKSIYRQFVSWCNSKGVPPVSIKQFQKIINSEILQGEHQLYSVTKDKLVADKLVYYLKNTIIQDGNRYILETDNGSEEVIKYNLKWYYKNHYCECGCGRNIPVHKTNQIPRYYNKIHEKHADSKNKRIVPRNSDSGNGYKFVFSTTHNKTIPMHRDVVEKHIGRKLKRDELVHHINLDKTDNNINNLVICDTSTHAKWHFDTWKLISELYRTKLIRFDESSGYYFSPELASFAYD